MPVTESNLNTQSGRRSEPQPYTPVNLQSKADNLKIQEREDILRMRKQWSWALMIILFFEAITTFGLVLLIAFHPEIGARLGKLIVETYIIKFVGEVLAMPLIGIKFLFDQKEETK